MLKLRVVACLLVSVLGRTPQLSGADLLEEVRGGNRAALESIRTLHCVVKKSVLVASVGAPGAGVSDYWSSGHSSRVRSKDDRAETDSVVNDLVARSLVRFRDAKGQDRARLSILRMEPAQPHGQCDPWGCGLLKLCGSKGWPRTLEELLQGPHEVNSVDRRRDGDHECIVVALSLELLPGQVGEFELWFDPQANYLARKLTGTSGDGISLRRRESEVLSFTELLPGVYFPNRVETRHYERDKLVHHDVVEFREIEINRPIAADTFEISIPPGATVHDAIEGIEYNTDSGGNRVGVVREIPRFAPLPAGAKQLTASTEEPQSWSRSVFFASLAVFIVCTTAWFIRRLRQA